jgi:DNA end-binding protein Ku
MCPEHGKVERDQMAKGYELTKGNFVELSIAELKALDAVASDEIAIEEFVPAPAIDPMFIERSYYLGPGKAADRAYQLFRDALVEADLVAIAAYAARGKQYVVELRPYETGLAMHQLRYPDEIKPWSELPAGKHIKAAPAELALARQVIDQLRHETFDPSRYKDQVKARVRALIASKSKGGEIIAPPSAPPPKVIDLMAALKASLGAGPPRRHGKAATTKRSAHAPRVTTRRARGAHATAGHATRSPARPTATRSVRKPASRRAAAHR